MLLEALRVVDCGVHGRRSGRSPDDPALEIELCLGPRWHRDAGVGLLDEERRERRGFGFGEAPQRAEFLASLISLLKAHLASGGGLDVDLAHPMRSLEFRMRFDRVASGQARHRFGPRIDIGGITADVSDAPRSSHSRCVASCRR